MSVRKSVVVGGGFVGLASALHLQRVGRQVTLIDRSPVGSAAAASYGNAGTMAAYANVPVNSPALLRKLPGMLMDAGSPVSVKPTAHLASMLPWAALFAWNCRPAAVERTAAGLGALLSRAESGYEDVWKQAGVDIDAPMGEHATLDAERPYAVRNGQGQIFVMKTEAAMQASEAAAAMRARHITGLRAEALSQEEVLSLEPHLHEDSCAGGGWFFPDGWFLSEPSALLRALAAGLERNGGEVRTGAGAIAVKGADGGGASIELEDGAVLAADEVVIAAGAHSAALVAGSLGEFCPLETERGYHVAFAPGTEGVLSRAVTDQPGSHTPQGPHALRATPATAGHAFPPAFPTPCRAPRCVRCTGDRPELRVDRDADGRRAARGRQGRAGRRARAAEPRALGSDRARDAERDRGRRRAGARLRLDGLPADDARLDARHWPLAHPPVRLVRLRPDQTSPPARPPPARLRSLPHRMPHVCHS